MPDIFVEDADTHQGIPNATFDHPADNGGGGFYVIDLGNDTIFTASAPGYNSTQTSILQTTFVQLKKSNGTGDGSCF